MKNNFRLGLTALVITAGALPGLAQSATTGQVFGKVTDGSGNPLAGARVILAGPSMMGPREILTGSDGVFRLALIPVGSGYSIKVSKQGFAAGEVKNVSIAAFANLGQNFTLKSGGEVAAVVEVVASNNAVDTVSVATSKTFNNATLQALPMASRDFTAAAYLTPGVADSGRGASNPAVAGGSGFENSVLIDGLNSTDPVYGRNETRMNTLALESVQVMTGGFEPEYGRSTGGIISAVTKSGGNDFQAELEYTMQPLSMAALPTANAALAFNANKNQTGDISNMAAWLGGAIIKDKLWYSLGVSRTSTANTQSASAPYILDPSLAPNANNPLARIIAGETAKSQEQTAINTSILAKVTFNLNTDNTMDFTVNSSKATNEFPSANGSMYTLNSTNPASQKYTSQADVNVYSANWRSNLSSTWLLDIRAGLYNRKTKNDESLPGYERPTIGFSGASFVTAGTRAYGGLRIGGQSITGPQDITRKQWTIKGTNFIGNVTLKYGIDYDETGYKSFSRYPGETQITRFVNVDPVTGAVTNFTDRYRFRTGGNGQQLKRADGTAVADALVLRGGKGLDLDSKTKNLAEFIQASWQITPTLQVIGGLRVDSQDLYGGDGVQYLKFSGSQMLAPRLGFTWDFKGDGRSKIQGNFGRFYETIPMDLNQRAGSIEGFATVQRTYSGPNANPFFIPNPTDYVLADGTMAGPNPALGGGTVTLRSVQGGEKAMIQSDIKPQAIEEIGFGYEQMVTAIWKVGAHYKYRYFKNVVEDYSFDNGHTYVIGNPGQHGVGLEPARITEYDYPGQNELIYFPKPTRHYREFTVTVNKEKGDSKWTFGMNFTFAKKEGNIDGLDASPQTGQVDPNITAFYDLPTLTRNARGPLPGAPKYNLQLTATYDLPFNLNLGLRYIYRAGAPITAFGPDLGDLIREENTNGDIVPDSYYMSNGQFLHFGNYGDGQAFLEPRGTRGFTPDVSRLDMHLEWNYERIFGTKVRATVFMDVFNVFNEQMTLTVNENKQFQTTVVGTNVNSQGAARSTGTTSGLIGVENPRFMLPTSFQAPRSIQLGMRLKF